VNVCKDIRTREVLWAFNAALRGFLWENMCFIWCFADFVPCFWHCIPRRCLLSAGGEGSVPSFGLHRHLGCTFIWVAPSLAELWRVRQCCRSF
jgi:hypothetical protein